MTITFALILSLRLVALLELLQVTDAAFLLLGAREIDREIVVEMLKINFNKIKCEIKMV